MLKKLIKFISFSTSLAIVNYFCMANLFAGAPFNSEMAEAPYGDIEYGAYPFSPPANSDTIIDMPGQGTDNLPYIPESEKYPVPSAPPAPIVDMPVQAYGIQPTPHETFNVAPPSYEKDEEKSNSCCWKSVLTGVGIAALLAGGAIGTYWGLQSQENELAIPELKAVGQVTDDQYTLDKWIPECVDISLKNPEEFEGCDLSYLCEDKNEEWKKGFLSCEQQEGENICQFKVTKEGEDKSKVVSKKIKVDTTPPTITAENDYILSNVPMTLNIADDNGSGINKLLIKKDDSDYVELTSEEAREWFETYPKQYQGETTYTTPNVKAIGKYTFKITDKTDNPKDVSIEVIPDENWTKDASGWRTKYINEQIEKNAGHVNIPLGAQIIPESCFESNWQVKSVNIPDTVTNIGSRAFTNADIKEIYIPKSVVNIQAAFQGANSLKLIEVDEENQYYSSVDGVLFNKDKTEIIAYPLGNSRESYTIPKNVSIIDFYNKKPFLPCKYTKYFNVEEGNENFTSIDGVLYSKDRKTLLQYPAGNDREDYIIPDGTVSIGSDAFDAASKIKSLLVPNTVNQVQVSGFHWMHNLESVRILNSSLCELVKNNLGTIYFTACPFLNIENVYCE